MGDKDSVWKEIIYRYFEDFLMFFFPHIWKDIAFDKGYEFLDKELEKIVKDSSVGKRYADVLVRVILKDGNEKWLLIHIEIQGYHDRDFAKRMYIYNYRIFDRYNKDVVSLSIFTDIANTTFSNRFERSYWDFKLLFEFPTVKIIDYEDKIDELLKDKNPFATVVVTHLKEGQTRNRIDDRRFWKLTLIRSLYEKGYTKDDILSLYRFIDWLVRLPKDIEEKLLDDISQIEEVKKMPYITNAERIGLERGMREGIEIGIEKGMREGIEKGIREGIEKGLGLAREGIKLALEIKFGGEGLMFYNRYVKDMGSIDELEELKEKIKKARKVEELL